MTRILYKLFHIEEALEANARDIQTKSKALDGLRSEHGENQTALEEARAEQARARTTVVREEKKVKKAEKALEAKVNWARCRLSNKLTISRSLNWWK